MQTISLARPRSLVLAVAVLAAGLSIALTAAPPSHAARVGTLTGKVVGLAAKRATAKRAISIRVIEARTAKLVKSVDVKGARFSIKVPPGQYAVIARSFDVPGRAASGMSRIASVKAGRKTAVALKVKSRVARASAAGAAAVPVVSASNLVLGVDPKFAVDGVDGYPSGLELDGLMITDLFEKKCKNGKTYDVVEIRHRDEILKEIKRGNSRYFDRKSRIKPKLVPATAMVTGGGTVIGGQANLNVRVVDVKTGSVVASAQVIGAEADLLVLIDQLTTELMQDLCGGRIKVTFAGSGSYDRYEGDAGTTGQHHVRSDFTWSATYNDVKLGAAPEIPYFAAVAEASGTWSDTGRFGAPGPGDFVCGGPLAHYSSMLTLAYVTPTDAGFRVSLSPWGTLQSDFMAKTCTGLGAPPYASFTMMGKEPFLQGVVEFGNGELDNGPITRQVTMAQPVPAACANLVNDPAYEPCSQNLVWSGTVTVERADG